MAARAGALIADPEVVQFHPTAIAGPRDPAPLVTEALRGEGAVLIDNMGRRFMTAIHEDSELGPRDIVARDLPRDRGRAGAFLDARAALGHVFRTPSRPSTRAASRSASTRCASRFQWRRRRITTWAAFMWMRAGAAALPACGPAVKSRPPACMAPIVSPAIRCSRPSSSAHASPPTLKVRCRARGRAFTSRRRCLLPRRRSMRRWWRSFARS